VRSGDTRVPFPFSRRSLTAVSSSTEYPPAERCLRQVPRSGPSRGRNLTARPTAQVSPGNVRQSTQGHRAKKTRRASGPVVMETIYSRFTLMRRIQVRAEPSLTRLREAITIGGRQQTKAQQ
jgi:hypothetical protein